MTYYQEKHDKTILYVDDEEKNLDSFRVIFRKDYNVKVANSAAEALEFMKKNSVSLVITDQRMPNMTGVEFLEKISGLYPDVIRVILSGYSDEEAIISAINIGKVFKYITKPWLKEELKQTIDYALETYRLRIENIELINKLSKANRELDEFVYRASHDLRAPIASIMGLINIAKHEHDLHKIKEYIGLKEKSLHVLDHLIRDIMNFSSNSHLKVKTDSINFKNIIESSLAELEEFRESSRVVKSYQINNNVPFISDQFRVELIINNLTSNAIRYARMDRDPPFLKIEVDISEKYSEIAISDNGIGIELKQQDRIFDMFYRASEENAGSGLGLYIVKETVDKLNGEITVQSKPNVGSTFMVKIPNLNNQ